MRAMSTSIEMSHIAAARREWVCMEVSEGRYRRGDGSKSDLMPPIPEGDLTVYLVLKIVPYALVL